MNRLFLTLVLLVYTYTLVAQTGSNSGTIKVIKPENQVDSIFTGDTVITLKMSVYYPNSFSPDSEKKIQTFYSKDSTCTVDEAIWRIISYYYESRYFNMASSIDMYTIKAISKDGNVKTLPHIDVLQKISDYRAKKKATNTNR